MHGWGLCPFKPLKKERNRVLIPHSYEERKRFNFYNEVRQYNASLVPWLRAEYKQLHDAEEAFYQYRQATQPKYSLLSRIKDWFKIFNFDMNFTQKSIEDYLSKSRDHYDLEEREKRIMRGYFALP